MTRGLYRLHESGPSHLLTFSCCAGLVKEPADWKWSSFRHYALREVLPVEIESEWTARDRETQPGTARVFLRPG